MFPIHPIPSIFLQEKPSSRAISEGIVPMEFVLMNVSHYLMFAYSDSRRALERIEDEETRQQLQHGLRAMQIAWGQADAVALAVERQDRSLNG
ncbi:hypothetical protein GCM10011247_00650 [Pseudomonas plecoglossicida]|nr:hypothetical protein GCM10011247_00650 [Pseudomonas plecoglossicida]